MSMITVCPYDNLNQVTAQIADLESANDLKQRRIDELEERVNALVARMVCPYKYTRLLYSRDCTVSPRKRSVDASEVHDSHHRIRFVLFTYNASYDPLAGAPSMLVINTFDWKSRQYVHSFYRLRETLPFPFVP